MGRLVPLKGNWFKKCVCFLFFSLFVFQFLVVDFLVHLGFFVVFLFGFFVGSINFCCGSFQTRQFKTNWSDNILGISQRGAAIYGMRITSLHCVVLHTVL